MGGLWWLYFHNHEGTIVRRRPGQKATWRPTAWIYGHLPLAIGVVATGIGLDFVLTEHSGVAERWILAGGLSTALLAMALIRYVTVNTAGLVANSKAIARLVAIPAVLIVGALAGDLPMGVTTTVLALVVAIEVFSDLIFEPYDSGAGD